jgi:hypothetical protein
MEFEQHHIIKFLHLKGLKREDIARELSNLSRQDASAKLSIKYWLHQLKLGRKDLTTECVGGKSSLDDTDTEILSLAGRSRFSSV